MLDIAVAYNRYMFVGHEFLTWLWFIAENNHEVLSKADPDLTGIRIGNRVVLENRSGDDRVETLTIKGDTAGLEEGMLALKKGAIVTELHLILYSGDQEWKFNLKGESLTLASLKVPETAPVERDDETEGAIIEKVFLLQKIQTAMDALFAIFLTLRTDEEWGSRLLPEIRSWITTTAQA